jgi:hypothetical protein
MSLLASMRTPVMVKRRRVDPDRSVVQRVALTPATVDQLACFLAEMSPSERARAGCTIDRLHGRADDGWRFYLIEDRGAPIGTLAIAPPRRAPWWRRLGRTVLRPSSPAGEVSCLTLRDRDRRRPEVLRRVLDAACIEAWRLGLARVFFAASRRRPLLGFAPDTARNLLLVLTNLRRRWRGERATWLLSRDVA